MSSAQMATRIFSGAENMPSYRGNLKPEDSHHCWRSSPHGTVYKRFVGKGATTWCPSND